MTFTSKTTATATSSAETDNGNLRARAEEKGDIMIKPQATKNMADLVDREEANIFPW